MAVVFSDQFQKECEGRLGVTKEAVMQVILQPEREQRLQSQGLTIVMYSKRTDRFMVIVTHLAGQEQVVDLAFSIKDELIETTKTTNPLPLLRALAQKTGLEIKIGDRQGRFIYNELIPIADRDLKKAMRVENPDGHPLASLMWIRVRENIMGPLAQCAMALCIDLQKYEEWLGQN
jgi:hypothetical protein